MTHHRTRTAAALFVSIAALAGCAPVDPDGDPEDSTDFDAAIGGKSIAEIALANLGGKACGINSEGGKGFGSSCTGNGGQPEHWCSDFAKWVWQTAGANVGGLSPAAGSFYCYGQNHGTLSNTPHVGDAVVFNYQGNCWADHVALVTKVNPNGTIETTSGNFGGSGSSQAQFAGSSKVTLNAPAFPGVVGSVPGPVGMTISGFISPTGLPAPEPPKPPPPPPEGSQAFLYPNQQHFVHRDGGGNVRHHFWDAGANKVITDSWGTGTAGTPVSFTHGTSQHVFARGTDGSIKHWFWDPANGGNKDTWAPAGAIAGDPAAIVIGDFEAVWAIDGAGNLQHYWWGPQTGGVKHDTWGSGVVGRPSVFLTESGHQHVFARGTGGTLEHWWWTPQDGVKHDTWGSGLSGDPASLAIGEFQDVWAVDGAGDLQHWFWGPKTNGVQHDKWGAGVVGRPSVFVTANGEQHAFARGKTGSVEHFFWIPNSTGIKHDTWGNGITQDPTAITIGAQQHLWALDGAGHAQHWFWDPAKNAVLHDDWGL